MASIFWDSQGVIMADYLEEGRTINSAYHAQELRRLRQEIVKKRRGNLTQDNVPAHTFQIVTAAATKYSRLSLSRNPRDYEILRDIRTSTYQNCRIEEKNNSNNHI